MVIELDQPSDVDQPYNNDAGAKRKLASAKRKLAFANRERRKMAFAKRKLASQMVDILSTDGAAEKTVGDVHCEMMGRMGVHFGLAEKKEHVQTLSQDIGAPCEETLQEILPRDEKEETNVKKEEGGDQLHQRRWC